MGHDLLSWETLDCSSLRGEEGGWQRLLGTKGLFTYLQVAQSLGCAGSPMETFTGLHKPLMKNSYWKPLLVWGSKTRSGLWLLFLVNGRLAETCEGFHWAPCTPQNPCYLQVSEKNTLHSQQQHKAGGHITAAAPPSPALGLLPLPTGDFVYTTTDV